MVSAATAIGNLLPAVVTIRVAKEALNVTGDAFTRKERVRGMNVPVSPLTARDFRTQGRLFRQRLPIGKNAHTEAGDTLARRAGRVGITTQRLIKEGLAQLKKSGVNPGPLTSGIISTRFPQKLKDKLRTNRDRQNALTGGAFAHYSAAGLQVTTARRRFFGPPSLRRSPNGNPLKRRSGRP